jgi:hypothetical protein
MCEVVLDNQPIGSLKLVRFQMSVRVKACNGFGGSVSDPLICPGSRKFDPLNDLVELRILWTHNTLKFRLERVSLDETLVPFYKPFGINCFFYCESLAF